MKILITGMTAMQAGARERMGIEDQYFSPLLLYPDILRELGHEVEHRECFPGEDVKSQGFDLALIGVHAFNSIVTMRYKHGALWAASQLPHAVIIDDMQWSDIFNSVKNQMAYWKCAHFDASQMRRFQAASKVSKQIEKVRRRWARGFDACLFTMFRWGDRSLLTRRHPIERIMDWDPSPWVPRWAEPAQMEDKRRAWVCACLRNQDAWIKSLNLSWPVEKRYKPWVGEKKIPDAPNWRVPETKIAELYSQCRGSLAYYHRDTAGTGWWRVRFNYVVEQANSIFCGHPDEVGPLGDSYLINPQDVEQMTIAEMRELAGEQLEAFDWHCRDDVTGPITKTTELARLRDYVARIPSQHGPIE